MEITSILDKSVLKNRFLEKKHTKSIDKILFNAPFMGPKNDVISSSAKFWPILMCHINKPY